jgi:Cys-tRNA synthase (O-phospho-L-seryl-tRNA:Cys-tRNA synthase)
LAISAGLTTPTSSRYARFSGRQAVAADDIADALRREPDVSAVLMITPTEYGTGVDVRTIARICHKRGIPLLNESITGHHG